MPILDERKPSKATSGRKKRVFFNAFFGRGRIFVILTKEMDETGSLDENLNRAFNAGGGELGVQRSAEAIEVRAKCSRATQPFASTGLREITDRTRSLYSCPPWSGEGISSQRGAFGVI